MLDLLDVIVEPQRPNIFDVAIPASIIIGIVVAVAAITLLIIFLVKRGKKTN